MINKIILALVITFTINFCVNLDAEAKCECRSFIENVNYKNSGALADSYQIDGAPVFQAGNVDQCVEAVKIHLMSRQELVNSCENFSFAVSCGAATIGDEQIDCNSINQEKIRETLESLVSNGEEDINFLFDSAASLKALFPFMTKQDFDDLDEYWDVKVTFLNDNGPIDAIDRVTGEGDDFGYTHGVVFEATKQLAGSYSLAIGVESHLYAKKLFEDEDDETLPIQFFEETLIGARLDNKRSRGSGSFWSFGLGYYGINDKEVGGFFSGSRQQKTYHEYTSAPDYTYVEGDFQAEGTYLMGSAGYKVNVPIDGYSSLLGFSEVGFFTNNVHEEGNYFFNRIEAEYYYHNSNDLIGVPYGLVGELETRYYPKDNQQPEVFGKVGFEIGNKSFLSCGLFLLKRLYGDGVGYRRYDDDNEYFRGMFCQKAF